MILLRKTFLLIALSAAVSACEINIDDDNTVEGSGPTVSRVIELSAIRGFDASGSFEVVIA